MIDITKRRLLKLLLICSLIFNRLSLHASIISWLFSMWRCPHLFLLIAHSLLLIRNFGIMNIVPRRPSLILLINNDVLRRRGARRNLFSKTIILSMLSLNIGLIWDYVPWLSHWLIRIIMRRRRRWWLMMIIVGIPKIVWWGMWYRRCWSHNLIRSLPIILNLVRWGTRPTICGMIWSAIVLLGLLDGLKTMRYLSFWSFILFSLLSHHLQASQFVSDELIVWLLLILEVF